MKKWFKKIGKIFYTGTAVGTKNFIIPAVDVLVADRPEFLPHWLLIRGYFGALFDLQQERINELVEFIQKNQEIFAKEIIATNEFKDGFVITFEEYLKQRNKRKRKYIQNILLGFTNSKNKINFELERMYDLLNKLSITHIFTLKQVYNYKSLEIINEDREKDREIYGTNYNELNYLHSLGLLDMGKEQNLDIDIETKKQPNNSEKVIGDFFSSTAEPYWEEKETYCLSFFGEEFIKFIIEK